MQWSVVTYKTNLVLNAGTRSLGQSVPLSPSCVLVVVGFWTVTRPAPPAAYQMSVRSVEWQHTP